VVDRHGAGRYPAASSAAGYGRHNRRCPPSAGPDGHRRIRHRGRATAERVRVLTGETPAQEADQPYPPHPQGAQTSVTPSRPTRVGAMPTPATPTSSPPGVLPVRGGSANVTFGRGGGRTVEVLGGLACDDARRGGDHGRGVQTQCGTRRSPAEVDHGEIPDIATPSSCNADEQRGRDRNPPDGAAAAEQHPPGNAIDEMPRRRHRRVPGTYPTVARVDIRSAPAANTRQRECTLLRHSAARVVHFRQCLPGHGLVRR
jgi:hypothetical protein